jgi:hypothetical protein
MYPMGHDLFLEYLFFCQTNPFLYANPAPLSKLKIIIRHDCAKGKIVNCHSSIVFCDELLKEALELRPAGHR